jgi:predicted DNA-binding transcriptional regulator YafY
MRADRLLSLLMMLQARGRMTARRLADELEVSERTIYRDVEALSMAGVPIYAERGPGGGCALLDGYRTTLTGLTEEEAHALFLLTIPAALADLGMSEGLKQALRKLMAALPDTFRHSEARVRQRIHLDWGEWFRAREPVPHLRTLQQAVWEDRQIVVTIRLLFGTHITWQIAPYGLVSKAGGWYLVYGRKDTIRAVPLSDVVDASLMVDRFERPADFDLAAFWSGWCAAYERNRPKYLVVARVGPELIPYLPHHFGGAIRQAVEEAQPDAAGWIVLTLPFETFEEARTRLLGFGRAVEVLEPQALRRSLIDFAQQVVEFYESHRRPGFSY